MKEVRDNMIIIRNSVERGELDISNIPQRKGLTDFQNLEEFVMTRAVNSVGSFESRLGGVREDFNKANIEFSIEWEGEQY